MNQFSQMVIQIKKYYNILRNNQYQLWRDHQQQYLKGQFIVYLIITFLCGIIQIGLVADGQKYQIILIIHIFLHILLFVLYLKLKETSYLEYLTFIQQQDVNLITFYIIQMDYSYIICFTAFNTQYISLYKSIHLKLSTIILFSVEAYFVLQKGTNIGIVFTIIIQLLYIIRKEMTSIIYYQTLNGLLMIIDSIPHPMCIVQKDKKQLVFSNKFYQKLANKLEGQQAIDTEQSPSRVNGSKIQLEFLQKLVLSDFRKEEYKILDETDMEDYKIRRVTYGKLSGTQLDISSGIPDKLRDKKISSTQQFFSLFNYKDESITRKQYTTDINVQFELINQPQQYLQSAMKRNRSSHMSQHRQSYKPSITSIPGNVSSDQLIKYDTQVVNHKMKFEVHLIENYKLIDEIDDTQIYFIHELSPVLLQNQVKKLESVKKNILRSISHELLNSVNAAYGQLKQTQDILQQMNVQCPRQLELAINYIRLQFLKVYDFFDYRDHLDDRLVMKQDKVMLNSVIDECIELYSDTIERKSLKLKVEIPERQYIVIGDRQRLLQLMLNLISNAVKYTLSGYIRISISKQQLMSSMLGIEEVEMDEDNTYIQVEVSDTGIGMDIEELSVLQKKLRFADEDQKISKNSVGIGVGLTICKHFVQKMGYDKCNHIFVSSIKDQGSTFKFCLPYIEEQNFLKRSIQNSVPQLDATNPQQVRVLNYKSRQPLMQGNLMESMDLVQKQCSCKTLLLVDDEQFNLNVLGHLVSKMGYDYETALNGQIALKMVQEKYNKRCSIDCEIYAAILMDLQMPVMGGWETVQRIRQIECELHLTQTIPVIAVTGFCSMKDQQKSIQEGFNYVILKPATQQKLQEAFDYVNQ